MAQARSGGLGETLRTVFYAVLIALGIRTVAFEPFNIPSGSMIPTLLVGDYLFVSKYSYGYSYKTLLFGWHLFDGRILGHSPERGDVAVFILPKDNSTDFIKRVIGLPGDHIQMIDGILNINGEPVKREFVRDVQSDCAGRVQTFKEYMETLPNGVRHVIHELNDTSDADNTPVFDVPENDYFMMGDNRDCSQDSRYQAAVGFVPLENFVGRAEVRWFSLEDASFWQFWKWPFALRYDRLFTGIE